ncbi:MULTISPECIES: GNAT family N-acetyltransferase [unclassified Spiroplasma]|uniref:GNAT family N-acetyltransferase n=1 Tax=unclassified Spiroplasma TaxID=2637901 RepID=UPI0030D0D932
MKIEIVNNIEILEQAFLIRKKVFVNEQKVPFEEEIDQFEDVSIHFLVFDDNDKPIATSRMRKVEDIVKIERMCILQEYRRLGIGKKLMEFMEKVAIKNQFKVISLYAQIQALNFYKNLGYKVWSEIFLDAGIKHCKMEKKIYNEGKF